MTFAVFASGAAALIFQIVWLHEAGLVFGNGVWATSLVLASFMGGLAVGNAVVAFAVVRVHRRLLVYAQLEAIVGLSGLALTYVFPYLVVLIAPLTGAIAQHLWLVNLIRLVLAFAILLVPATAMGATLPIVVGACAERDAGLGPVLGRLYGWNTLGAVVGVICAEVVTVGRVGIRGSGVVAALLDITAAVTALYVSGRSSRRGAFDVDRPQSSVMPSWRWLACAFLSGGALLSLEVIWFRFLTMYVLSTTMAVSVMLATVLASIALGGLFASRWLTRRPDVAGTLAATTLAAGATAAGTYLAFHRLTSGTQIAEWYRVLWLACVLAAPTSFLSGVIYTLTGHVIQRDLLRRAGSDDTGDTSTGATAWLTLANTAGAMCGPLLAAFVLLPAIGIEGAILVLAAAYAGIAILVLGSTTEWRGVAASPAFLAVAVALTIAIASFVVASPRDRDFARAAQTYGADGSQIVATREGPSETIFLMQQRWLGQPVYDRLVTNGFSMSGDSVPAMRYMRYFAYWPMLLHQAPLKRALVICYGVGVTAGAVADISSLASIDVVEISKDVVAMSDLMYAGRTRPLHDPRVRLHLEDGRAFLQTSRDRFDLVTGEPPPPRTPGAVNIYTREYFQLIYDHLSDGGITTYWLPVARPDPGTDVDTIVRAFCDVFTDCSLWNGTPFDLMLAGSRHGGGPVSGQTFASPWVTPGLEARLREVGLEQPEEIGATFIGDATYLQTLTARTPPLVDDFPQRLLPGDRISLSDPRYRSDPAVADFYQRTIDPSSARMRFASSDFIRHLWPAELIERSLPAFDDQRIINRVLWEGGQPLRQIEDLDFVLTRTSLRTLPLWILGTDEVKERIAETATADQSGAVQYARALRALAGRDYATAGSLFADAARRGLEGQTIRPLLAYALCRSGDIEAARSVAQGLVPHDSDETHFWTWMASAFDVGPH